MPLPAIGSVPSFGCKDREQEIFFSLNTFTAPPTVYRYDIPTGRTTCYHTPQVAYDAAQYTTEQLFFESSDGEHVPMFVSHRRGLRLDGSNPCYLYGYGGFQINLTPGFTPTTILFVEQNARIALATAQRSYVLQTGKIELTDTCENLISNEEVQRIYLGTN